MLGGKRGSEKINYLMPNGRSARGVKKTPRERLKSHDPWRSYVARKSKPIFGVSSKMSRLICPGRPDWTLKTMGIENYGVIDIDIEKYVAIDLDTEKYAHRLLGD